MTLQDQEIDLPELELPILPSVASIPPRRTLLEMLPWLERMRQCYPQSIPTEEQRLARKVSAEFIL